MPDRCVAFGCSSGYDNPARTHDDNGHKISIFKIPEGSYEEYERKLKLGRNLKKGDKICSLHFYSSDIVRCHDDIIVNGLIIKGSPLKNPRIRPGALPNIFEGCPAYMTTLEKPKRAHPKFRGNAATVKKQILKDKENGESSLQESSLSSLQGVPEVEATAPEISEESPSLSKSCDTQKKQPHTSGTSTGRALDFDVTHIKLPNSQWAIAQQADFHFNIVKIKDTRSMGGITVSHGIRLEYDKVEIEVNGKKLEAMNADVTDKSSLEGLIQKVDRLKLCEGPGFGQHAAMCPGWVIGRAERCFHCKGLRAADRKRKKRMNKLKMNNTGSTVKQKLQNLKRSRKRILSKVQKLKNEVANLRKQCRDIEKEDLRKKIKALKLPEEQQLMILSCMKTASVKANGRRYDLRWIYECILMRIKSPTLYNHLRLRKILPLPCRATLNRYMRKLHPMYGYQDTLFETIKKKVSGFSEVQRHGNILVDEMKLQPGVEYDKHLLEHWGIVEVADEKTPESGRIKAELGDHALVVQFVPFQGGWNQVLACFLSKGNVKGKPLSKIVLEGVTLAENAGLRVDAVTSDGARWNHNMWAEFGVGEEKSSCEHPCDDKRRLWFFSDWCHLLKTMRNNLCPLPPSSKNKSKKKKAPGEYIEEEEEVDVDEPSPIQPQQGTSKRGKRKSQEVTGAPPRKIIVEASNSVPEAAPAKINTDYLFKTLHTPDGLVKRQHWLGLWRAEEKLVNQNKMRFVPGLEEHTVKPSGFQRMNVGQAYKFFSHDVVAGMLHYKSQGVPDLQDCEPTAKFVTRIADLAKAMNSGGSKGALWENCKEEKDIEEFQEYHKQCIQTARANGRKHFWSELTDIGLTVTLSSTLELTRYLRSIGFRFVMTKRFNQDALEQFFGNIRRAAAPNPHPDPKLFAQLFRLLSMYSLVSPVKGSNVSGVDNIESLLSADDKFGADLEKRREEFEESIDEILVYGRLLSCLLNDSTFDDHHYTNVSVDKELNQFMAGFTVAKQKHITNGCEQCLETMMKSRDEAGPDDAFVLLKEKYDGYSYPTDAMARLIGCLQAAMYDCIRRHQMHRDFVFTTLKYIRIDASCYVGCLDHITDVTKKLMMYYIRCMMHFTSSMKNAEHKRAKEKTKSLRKQSKNV